jgi:hypothetical protein
VIDLGRRLVAAGGDAVRVAQQEPRAEAAPRRERVELPIGTSSLVVCLLTCLGVCGTACAAWYSEGRAARLGARRAWARGHQLYLI